MEKLEHIGIAVKSLSDSIPLFEALLNTDCYKEELVESEAVKTAFFSVGTQKIELLESTVPTVSSPDLSKKREKAFIISHLP